jgi:hypothetical protein
MKRGVEIIDSWDTRLTSTSFRARPCSYPRRDNEKSPYSCCVRDSWPLRWRHGFRQTGSPSTALDGSSRNWAPLQLSCHRLCLDRVASINHNIFDSLARPVISSNSFISLISHSDVILRSASHASGSS